MNLLSSPGIMRIEAKMASLFDRTFSKAASVRTLNYSSELPRNVKRWFKSAIFSEQLDKLITDLIRESILHADDQMKILTAAKLGESKVLTEEAVKLSGELTSEVTQSIIRMLKDDAIYYQHPKQLSSRILDLWGGQRYRANRFTQTFTADVATATTTHRYRQYNVIYMEFDAERDDKTTKQCECLDGTIFDLRKDSVDRYRPPLHFHCRSGLKPVPSSMKVDDDKIFENRDFSDTIGDPEAVRKAFENIDKFNDKYRISQYILDQDLAARIMFEKGVWVGVEGPSLDGMLDLLSKDAVEEIVHEVAKTAYTPVNTIKEAEQWAKSNTSVVHVDYKGLDVKTANAMNEALARHLELNPELANKIRYYGTAQGQATLAYKLDIEAATQKFMSVGYDREKAEQFAQAVVSKYRIPSNNVAHYWRRTDDAAGIAFNKNAGKYFDQLEKNLARDVASGFHPEGCSTVKSMIDHEFGHALDDVYKIKSDPRFITYIKDMSAGEKAIAVSKYGATNSDEFIAEAWAEYLNNPTPRPAAKLIGDLITSKMK